MTRSSLNAGLLAATAGLLLAPNAMSQEVTERQLAAQTEAMQRLRVAPAPVAPMAPTDLNTTRARGGGGTPVDLFEDFQTHPLSTEPVFDRYQRILPFDQPSQVFEWTSAQLISSIVTLFVEGQVNQFGTPDPLPRWHGTAMHEAAAPVTVDLNGDGAIDAADLGIIIREQGAIGPGLTGDLNSDSQVDMADLSLLVDAFGDPLPEYCLYEVLEVFERDPNGFLLPIGTLDNGPFARQHIALAASPDCGACDSFKLTQMGTETEIYGKWKLVDSATTDLSEAAFYGDFESTSCPDRGDSRTLALIRGESGLANEDCCFISLRGDLRGTYVAHDLEDVDLICEMDIFMPSFESFLWTDFVSSESTLTMSRLFLGGFAATLSLEFFPFTDELGLIDRFVILGPGDTPDTGSFYGTLPDPDYIDNSTPIPTPTPLPGKRAIAGEWFTIRHVITSDLTQEVWVRDSETMKLVDPAPGDNGRSTPTLLDDIEDGFARIYPSGPFGRIVRSTGVFAPDPAPPVASTSASSFRLLYGNEFLFLPRPDRNHFIDNIRIRGLEFPLTR